MSKNDRSCQSREENTPRAPAPRSIITIPLEKYVRLLKVHMAFDFIINAANESGVSRGTIDAACKSLGIDLMEGRDA